MGLYEHWSGCLGAQGPVFLLHTNQRVEAHMFPFSGCCQAVFQIPNVFLNFIMVKTHLPPENLPCSLSLPPV